MQCRLWPRNDDEWRIVREQQVDVSRVLRIEDLVRSDNVVFAATGITSSEFLRGVAFVSGGATTHSVVMRSSSGTVRYIESRHRWDKLMSPTTRGSREPWAVALRDTIAVVCPQRY